MAYPGGMSSVRNPVGPQPPSVYWRRRALVLLGLIAIIVIIVLIVTRPAASPGQQTPSPSPTATGGSAAGSGNEEELCNPAAIVIEPLTDNNPYPAGVQPLISMRITNTGSSGCTLDVGTAEQYYAIVSGSDPIWNSRDCQTDSTSRLFVLEPNEPATTTPLPWDRTRSSPNTCSSPRPEVVAAGSTYRLSVSLGDIEAASDLAFILN